jgi:hypothetical protein
VRKAACASPTSPLPLATSPNVSRLGWLRTVTSAMIWTSLLIMKRAGLTGGYLHAKLDGKINQLLRQRNLLFASAP